jgi:hypothetical protein
VEAAEKVNQTPRMSAIGRTACPGLGGIIEARGESVLCVRIVIVCEARLSMDCARVKELQVE